MSEIRCICGTKITGGADTFGDPSTPMCWTCWSTLEWEDGIPKMDVFPIYGWEGYAIYINGESELIAVVRR